MSTEFGNANQRLGFRCTRCAVFTSAGNKWSRAQYVSLQPEPTGSRRWFPGDKHRTKTSLQKNSYCFKITIYVNVTSCI